MARIPFPSLRILGGILAGLSCFVVPAAAQLDVFGSGAAWFDCNGDEYLDLCYVTPEGQVVLLVYDPQNEEFADSSALIPQSIQGVSSGTGVACGDLNNDGLSDIFLTFGPANNGQGGAEHLLLNRGTSFQVVSRPAGIHPGDQGDVLSGSAALIDYDNDGLLDIYVANYGDPFLANDGWSEQLFHNTGVDQNGVPHFTDVAATLGVDKPYNGQSNWTLGLATFDYDNDGDADLYLANDYNGLDQFGNCCRDGDNILYRNEGGTFVDVSYSSGAADPGWAMGVSVGDYDRDGWLDLYVTNFWEDALLRNNGNGTFTNVTALCGLPTERLYDQPCTVCNGWGTAFLDFDNDGDLDIHVVNGWITNDQGQTLDEPDDLWENIGVGQNGHIQFVNVAAEAGVANIGDGRGSAYGDLNHDGFVDIIVINNEVIDDGNTAPDRILYINQGDGTFRDLAMSYKVRTTEGDGPASPPRGDFSGFHWIQVRPVGVTSNRSGIGSRITVEAGGRTWIQDVGAGSYCSTNSPFVHFGLGTAASIDRVTVRFPSGTTIVKRNPFIDSMLIVSEDDPVPVRLLSLTAVPEEHGVRVRWDVTDDGELAEVLLVRGSVFELSFPGRAGEFFDREVPENVTLLYRLDALLRNGMREELGSVTAFRPAAPRLVLGQNRPNPFSGATVIPVEGSTGTLSIFDVQGRLVREWPTASGTIEWDGRDQKGRQVPSGTYYYRFAGSPVLRMIRRH